MTANLVPLPLVPPHNATAEREILRVALLRPERIDELARIVRAEHFYLDAHARIWEAVQFVQLRGETVDAVSVCSELRRTERYWRVGGAVAVAEILLGDPHELDAADCAGEVVQCWRARTLIAKTQSLVAELYTRRVGANDAWGRLKEILR